MHAVAQRQVLLHTKIVLHVPAELIMRILDERIADALRVLRRQASLVCGEVRELKSSKSIVEFVAAITCGVELPAKTNSVFLERVVDVVCDLQIELVSSTRALRAAVVEGARNQNRSSKTR